MKNLLRPVVRKLVLSTCCLLISMNSLHAEVVTDGTLGQVAQLTGPNFQINSNLGQQLGGNLFHSFSRFNVNTGETATFTGPESVTNILARVTGGQRSLIDGTLRSTIPNANLYLLNPNGILFGEQASLDISGSFHASTADYVNLGDGGRFYARVGDNPSILTVAPPSAFGFLNNQAASISIRGSVLETTEGKKLSLSGGDISFEKEAGLFAPKGEINLTSEIGGNISMVGESWLFAPGGKINLTSKLGDINISHSYVNVSGDEYYGGEIGGEIFIRAGQLFIKDSYLYAQGFRKGGNLTINAPIFAMDNSLLVANSWSGEREGGNISISTDQFTLSKNNTIIGSSKLSMGGRLLDISMKEAKRSITSDNPTSFQAFSKLGSLSSNRCGSFSKENQIRFVITASDIPQETPYDLQTHWVLPRRR